MSRNGPRWMDERRIATPYVRTPTGCFSLLQSLKLGFPAYADLPEERCYER